MPKYVVEITVSDRDVLLERVVPFVNSFRSNVVQLTRLETVKPATHQPIKKPAGAIPVEKVSPRRLGGLNTWQHVLACIKLAPTVAVSKTDVSKYFTDMGYQRSSAYYAITDVIEGRRGAPAALEWTPDGRLKFREDFSWDQAPAAVREYVETHPNGG